MKKMNKVLSTVVAMFFLSATYAYAEEPTVNRYVQLKDGVVFAYVESTREVGNSILLPPGVTWEDVKEKKYENGNFIEAPVIKTVTEIVDNKVAQTSTTVFSSDAKGDVVSSDVQLGWHKDNNGAYTNSAPQPTEPAIGSFNRSVIQDTATILVNIVGDSNTAIAFVGDSNTATIFNNAATLSVNEKSNHEINTYVESNGLKVTKFLEATQTISFNNPKTIEQIDASINGNYSMIRRYLNIFFQLLSGWIVTPIVN